MLEYPTMSAKTFNPGTINEKVALADLNLRLDQGRLRDRHRRQRRGQIHAC